MRKIMSEEDREAKNTRNKKIFAWVIGAIMLFSTFAIFIDSDWGITTKSEKATFGGIDFQKTNGYWQFTINSQNFETFFNPAEVSNISVQLNKNIQAYNGKYLYFGINSLEDLAVQGNSEIVKVLGQYIPNYQPSCLSQNCTEDAPIKNCSANNVLVFKKTNLNYSKVYEAYSNCVIIEFTEGDEVRAADAFLFNVLGFRSS